MRLQEQQGKLGGELIKGLAYLKAGFSLAAVRGALNTAAAAVFNANSTAA